MSVALNARTVTGSTVGTAANVVEVKPQTRSGFIIGPVRDALFIIGAPLVALIIAVALFWLPKSAFTATVNGGDVDLRQIFIASFVAAHLVLVFFRSHANPKIFWTHPLRFTVVPLVLLFSMTTSVWLFCLVGVIAVWWDVYHSSLQTFGFGRIYDAKQGNNAVAGRKLDIAMNLFLYTGPVLAGAQFAGHLELSVKKFTFLQASDNSLRNLVLQQAPNFLNGNQRYLTIAVLAAGIPFLSFYLFSYYRLCRAGYHVSWQKVSLLVITGCVSTYVWGFRSFFDAFWVMNFFHALQYFAIVFFTEGKNLARLFRVDRFSLGAAVALLWIVVLTFAYGFWATIYVSGMWMQSAVLTVAIMHFWYDGFIWSVKKKQV